MITTPAAIAMYHDWRWSTLFNQSMSGTASLTPHLASTCRTAATDVKADRMLA
jgi:hypothetical protein